MSNQLQWLCSRVMLRKGQVNTDTLVLTLPLNGSSINTKYLFRCYCATSVPNDLLILHSPSLRVSKYTRKRERLAGSWSCCACLEVVQHQSPFNSLYMGKSLHHCLGVCLTGQGFARCGQNQTLPIESALYFLQFDTSTCEHQWGWQTWRIPVKGCRSITLLRFMKGKKENLKKKS